MADIPVTKKSSSHWWIWLIGLILLAVVIWFLWGILGGDRTSTGSAPSSTAPAATTAPPATATGASPSTAPPQGGAAPSGETGEAITDAGTYAATADKLSLVGKRAELTGARVERIVGPKTFTVASGNEELYVMIDGDLTQAVGTQGKIDKGSVLNMKGSFRRLTAEEISNISDNRFRDLTDREREALRMRQVYLHATAFSKIS